MGAVRMIRHGSAVPTLSEAIIAYLATLDHPETAGTRRVYASTLRQLRAYLGPELPVATLDEPDTATRLAGWLAARWGTRAPATIQPAEKQSDYVEVRPSCAHTTRLAWRWNQSVISSGCNGRPSGQVNTRSLVSASSMTARSSAWRRRCAPSASRVAGSRASERRPLGVLVSDSCTW